MGHRGNHHCKSSASQPDRRADPDQDDSKAKKRTKDTDGGAASDRSLLRQGKVHLGRERGVLSRQRLFHLFEQLLFVL